MDENQPIDADALYDAAMAPESPKDVGAEGTINSSPATEGGNTEPTTTPVSEGNSTFSITHKGKELTLDDEKYKGYAQKGYDYETKMHQFRVDQKLFEQKQEQAKEQYDQIKQIDDYAKANPQFNQLIQDQWAQIQAGNIPEMNPQTEVQVLKSQIGQIMESMNSQKESQEARRVAELEASQEGAISKYKDANKSMDWETKDAEGNTLEDRIGHAMLEKGVKDFNIMADSFLLKQHMASKTLEGKESAAKAIQKNNKLGLGKVTEQSTLGVKKGEDFRNKSYDDLTKEAFAELGIDYG